MANGPRKHMKRLAAPSHWMLNKLCGTWAPRPSTGPHKLRECLPMSLILRNRLKYSLTRRETIMVVMRRLVQIDGKIRTDLNYPAGFMDVLSIPKTNENFRLLYDVQGRFVLHRITSEEASFKLCRVLKAAKAKKASIGRNPFLAGQAAAIPYIVTDDGRTIRFADPAIKINDTIKLDIATGKIVGHTKYEVGSLVMVTKGANVGRIGTLVAKEKHPGSFEIVHIRDKRGVDFATRLSNVFVIGEGQNALISLPRGKGIKKTILETSIDKASGKKE